MKKEEGKMKCGECNSGVRADGLMACNACGGRGEIEVDTGDGIGDNEAVMEHCDECEGLGWVGDCGPGIEGNSEYVRCECVEAPTVRWIIEIESGDTPGLWQPVEYPKTPEQALEKAAEWREWLKIKGNTWHNLRVVKLTTTRQEVLPAVNDKDVDCGDCNAGVRADGLGACNACGGSASMGSVPRLILRYRKLAEAYERLLDEPDDVLWAKMKDSDRDAWDEKRDAILDYRGICEGKMIVYTEVAGSLEFRMQQNSNQTTP